MHSDLTWLLTRNNNSSLVKRNGVSFSKDRDNLAGVNSPRFNSYLKPYKVGVDHDAKSKEIIVKFTKVNKFTSSRAALNSGSKEPFVRRVKFPADKPLNKSTLAKIRKVASYRNRGFRKALLERTLKEFAVLNDKLVSKSPFKPCHAKLEAEPSEAKDVRDDDNKAMEIEE